MRKLKEFLAIFLSYFFIIQPFFIPLALSYGIQRSTFSNQRNLGIGFIPVQKSLSPIRGMTQQVPSPLAGEGQGEGILKNLELQPTNSGYIKQAVNRLPIQFIENRGQVDEKVKYYARYDGTTIWFTDDEIVFDFIRAKRDLTTENTEKNAERTEMRDVVAEPCSASSNKRPISHELRTTEYDRQVIRMKLQNSNHHPSIFGKNKLHGIVNYFIGNDPKKWETNISSYNEVYYKNVYEGIDLKFYAINQAMEYDFIVHHGADPDKIQVAFEGIDGMEVDNNGDLIVKTAFGDLKHKKPHVYQEIKGRQVKVDCKFSVQSSVFGYGTRATSHEPRFTGYSFKVASYNSKYSLIIDPSLVFSTYLGGGNNDNGYDIALDNSNNVYITGVTYSSDFPKSSTPIDGTIGGTIDVFVAKINSTGSNIFYSTYLGGSNTDEHSSIAVDNSGNVWVIGSTWSIDFPTLSPLQNSHGGKSDVFVAKINASGTSLGYSTYLGGYEDEYAGGIAVDTTGDVYITGTTGSPNFPISIYAVDKILSASDAFVTKISASGTNILYSTYLGGGARDEGFDIAVDTSGNTYVTGKTESSNFPTAFPIQNYHPGNWDAFVTKINSSGSSFIYSTYLGGGVGDWGNSIAVDAPGSAYITGQTGSNDFPKSNPSIDNTVENGYDAFVTKIDSSGTNIVYSTYLGGSSGDEAGNNIVVDKSGNAHITGWTISVDFPRISSIDWTFAGERDAFVAKIETSGQNLVFSTFIGGNGYEEGNGIAVDTTGVIYVVGKTNSSDFPLVSPIYSTNSGGFDVFVSKIPNIEAVPPQQTFFGNSSTASFAIDFGSGPVSSSNNLNQSGFIAEPVNTAIGNYTYQHTDLSIPGRGLSFTFSRGYNSLDDYNGPLGYGWTHSYNTNLTINTDSSVSVKWGDGQEVFYNAPDTNGNCAPKYVGTFDALKKNVDGTYTLINKEQTSFNFNTSGKLTTITDKNGNIISCSYDGSGNLSTVTDTVGRVINFTYNGNNHIAKITDPINRTIEFSYDSNGNLATSKDPNGKATTYSYDSEHRMIKAVLPKGNTLFENTFVGGKVISQRNGKGNETRFAYDTPDTGETTITDPMGFITIHTHDSQYRLIKETDANNKTIEYTYDSSNNRTQIKDKNGNITKYTYDAMGNVTGKINALNKNITITYDSKNNPLTKKDEAGNTTIYTYDANGNLLSSTDPLGNSDAITYDSYGQILTITDKNGNVTTNSYDSEGNLVKIKDTLGNETTFTYDAVGRKISQTDARGNKTTYTYDSNNNLLSIIDPLGNTTTYTYHTNNNKETITDPKGNTTTFVYDENDLLKSITDPLLNSTYYAYDANDNKVSITDARLNITKFKYDGVKNLVEIEDALGNKTYYEYDGNGNRASIIDGKGRKTRFEYDELNRLTKTIDPLLNSTQNSYDELGRLTVVKDAEEKITKFGYDALGRLTQVIDALNNVTEYEYDKVGNRTKIIDPRGKITEFAYDSLNRLISETDPLLNTTTYEYDTVGNRTKRTDADGNITNYTYDENNRLKKIDYPDTSSITYTYDKNGNRESIVDKNGTSAFTYDKLNRLLSYTDSYEKKVTYTYDSVGNITSIQYPNGKKVTYKFDELNRLSKVTDWLLYETSYTYDEVGNLSQVTNGNGTFATYIYDDASRLIKLTNKKANGTIISDSDLTLDSVGNRIKIGKSQPLFPIQIGANVDYTYNDDNRLTNAESAVYTYDKRGNLTDETGIKPKQLDYDYENRLTSALTSSETNNYTYDSMGNRIASGSKRYILDINSGLTNVIAEADNSGNITNYYVHGLGLISKVTPTGDAFYCHYDPLGSTIAITDKDQNYVAMYAYDEFGNVANMDEYTGTGFSSNPFRFVGKYGVMDEGNGLYFMRARYYDSDKGRFISKDPLIGTFTESQSLNRYVYVKNNPIILLDASGLTGRKDENYKNKNFSYPIDVNSYSFKLADLMSRPDLYGTLPSIPSEPSISGSILTPSLGYNSIKFLSALTEAQNKNTSESWGKTVENFLTTVAGIVPNAGGISLPIIFDLTRRSREHVETNVKAIRGEGQFKSPLTGRSVSLEGLFYIPDNDVRKLKAAPTEEQVEWARRELGNR